MHVRLHLITAAAYESPRAVLATRLLVRTLDDLLMPSGGWWQNATRRMMCYT